MAEAFVVAIFHYYDVIMGSMASQITSLTIVYPTVHSGADQRKHQSSASLAFVREIHRWPVNYPPKWQVTRKMFPFYDVIIQGVIGDHNDAWCEVNIPHLNSIDVLLLIIGWCFEGYAHIYALHFIDKRQRVYWSYINYFACLVYKIWIVWVFLDLPSYL